VNAVRRVLRLFVLVAVSLGAGRASADGLPTDATLARLISDSLAVRPELAAARAVAVAADERIPQAGALPDPMLQLGVQNDGFTSLEIGRMETSYVSLMASQTLPWPGKRDLRTAVATVSATAAKAAITRVQLSTEADVRRGYLALMLAHDRLALLAQLEGIWQQAQAVARTRYESADGAQADVLRARLELARLGQRRVVLQAEIRGRIEGLNQLRDHPLDEVITPTSHLRELPALATFAAAFSVERALAESPELAAARLGQVRGEHLVALADKGRDPDLTVSAGLMIRGGLAPMWLVTVGGPLPLFAGRKQDHAVRESRALVTAAAAEAAALTQRLRLRTAERATIFAAQREVVEAYDQGLLVLAQATADSTVTAYAAGKASFAAVLEANAGLVADREAYLEGIAAAYGVLIDDAELTLAPSAAVGVTGGGGRMASGAGSSGGGGGRAAPDAADAAGGAPASM
jgi:outer membrane protein TolC